MATVNPAVRPWTLPNHMSLVVAQKLFRSVGRTSTWTVDRCWRARDADGARALKIEKDAEVEEKTASPTS